jgi:hypothetical protein
LNEGAATEVIRYIYRNISNFSEKEVYGFFDSDRDSAIRLILFLVNDDVAPENMQGLINEIMKTANDMSFVTKIMIFNGKQTGQINNIYKNVNATTVAELLGKKLTSIYLKENQNVLTDNKWPYILHQWATGWGLTDRDNSSEVKQYTTRLITEHPDSLRIILEKYYTKHFPDDIEKFDMVGLGNICNIDLLKDEASKHLKDNDTDVELFSKFLQQATEVGEPSPKPQESS